MHAPRYAAHQASKPALYVDWAEHASSHYYCTAALLIFASLYTLALHVFLRE
jgi:hypothetical protein